MEDRVRDMKRQTSAELKKATENEIRLGCEGISVIGRDISANIFCCLTICNDLDGRLKYIAGLHQDFGLVVFRLTRFFIGCFGVFRISD